MRTIPTLVSRLVMVTTLGAFAATLAEAQSRAPTPVPPAPATRAPTPVATTPVTTTPATRAPVPVTPVTTTPATRAPVPVTPVTTTPVTRAPVPVTPSRRRRTRAPVPVTPVTTTPVTRAPVPVTPVTTTPVTRAPVPVTPQSTDPDLIEQIRELVGGRQSAWSAVLPPESRFQIALVGGEAVLDRETNLVWEKSPSTVLEDWRRANNQCNGMTLGGRKGWRLPTVQELASLLEAGETGTTLPDGHPFANVQPQAVLVGHSHHGGFAIRLGVSFPDGAVGYLRLNTTRLFWCVRGPGGVDVQ